MKKIKNIAGLIAKYNSYKITKEELRNILKSEPFGRVTGIIGPFVLRYHKDKLIISDRAVIYNASQSAESVQNRRNFAAQIRFARAVNEIDIINEAWHQAELEGNYSFHRIIRNNKMTEGRPSIKNTITPPVHRLYAKELCSLDHDLCIRIRDNFEFNKNEHLVAVIVPYDPIDASDNCFEIVKVSCAYPDRGSFVQLSEEQIAVCRRYNKYVMYSAVLRENGDEVEWSNTVVEEGRVVSSEKIAEAAIFTIGLILFQRGLYQQIISVYDKKRKIIVFGDG